MTGYKYTLEDQGWGREFPRDRPVWYDCPLLDIPSTMLRVIGTMPDNVVAVTLVDFPVRWHTFMAVAACELRGFEVVYADWNTMARDRAPAGF